MRGVSSPNESQCLLVVRDDLYEKIAFYFRINRSSYRCRYWGRYRKEAGKAAFFSSKSDSGTGEAELYEGFNKAAELSNKRGPIMVDQDTRWDKTVAGPGARLTYYYSFPKYSSLDIKRDWLLTNIQPEVKKSVCGSEEMKHHSNMVELMFTHI